MLAALSEQVWLLELPILVIVINLHTEVEEQNAESKPSVNLIV